MWLHHKGLGGYTGCLPPLSLALSRLWRGPPPSSRDSSSSPQRRGALSQSPRTQFIRTHPPLPWKLQAHRAWLIVLVPEFTQASSTIRQDEFLSWSLMRPGHPESIWQPPRGGQSPRKAHCCRKVTRPLPSLGRRSGLDWGALPSFRILQGQRSLCVSSAGAMGKRKNKLPISVPGPSGAFLLHPLMDLPTNASHTVEAALLTRNRVFYLCKKYKHVPQKSLLGHLWARHEGTCHGIYGVACSLPRRTWALPSGWKDRACAATTISIPQRHEKPGV